MPYQEPSFPISQQILLIKTGFQLLKESKRYKQTDIVQKLEKLNCKTNKATFNKILNDKKVSVDALFFVSKGMAALLEKELCLKMNSLGILEEIANCKPETVEIEGLKDKETTGFLLHEEGRLELQEKVKFMETAEEEIIEFGTTLNAFSNYLLSNKAKLFKLPIKNLLEKGIKFKCYLLDPEWNGTSFYCGDRENAIKEGQPGIEKIRTSLRRLKQVQKEFALEGLATHFEVFTYRHIPHNYFMILDKNQNANAKMMVSNYLYGMRRADCPVLEFSRQSNPILFQRYLTSFEKLTKQAKKVDFESIPD